MRPPQGPDPAKRRHLQRLAQRVTALPTKSPQIGLYDGNREQCDTLYTVELSLALSRLVEIPPSLFDEALEHRLEALRRDAGLHLCQAQPGTVLIMIPTFPTLPKFPQFA